LVFTTQEKVDPLTASRNDKTDEKENGEWGTSKTEIHPHNEPN
jgi:hypothetical protein